MRAALQAVMGATALVAAMSVSGCRGRDADANAGDTARHAADTSVTERTVEDTTIVTHDTLIRSDTIVKAGSARDTTRPRRP